MVDTLPSHFSLPLCIPPFTGPHLSRESKVTRKEQPALILESRLHYHPFDPTGMLRSHQPLVFMKRA